MSHLELVPGYSRRTNGQICHFLSCSTTAWSSPNGSRHPLSSIEDRSSELLDPAGGNSGRRWLRCTTSQKQSLPRSLVCSILGSEYLREKYLVNGPESHSLEGGRARAPSYLFRGVKQVCTCSLYRLPTGAIFQQLR